MADNIISINDKEYDVTQFNQQQTYFLNQIKNIDDKMGDLGFQMDQLSGARQFFINNLTSSLEEGNIADQLPD